MQFLKSHGIWKCQPSSVGHVNLYKSIHYGIWLLKRHPKFFLWSSWPNPRMVRWWSVDEWSVRQCPVIEKLKICMYKFSSKVNRVYTVYKLSNKLNHWIRLISPVNCFLPVAYYHPLCILSLWFIASIPSLRLQLKFSVNQKDCTKLNSHGTAWNWSAKQITNRKQK